MDRITETLLSDFSKEHEIEALDESKRFEHFTAFSMMRRHYGRHFLTEDIVLGGGGDTGLDAVAIIVNNQIVTDVDDLDDLHRTNGYIEPTYIFVQADRGAGFENAKLGTIIYGIVDFFKSTPTLPRSPQIKEIAEISDTIINKYAAHIRSPKCYVYYVTTGQPVDDAMLLSRKSAAESDLRALSLFETCEVHYVGAGELNDAYRRTRSPVVRTFTFRDRVEVPATAGVTASAIGFLPFREFIKLLVDDSGQNILTTIFDDNIRDYQNGKPVNLSIKATLASEQERAKFVLMNNGVTIIARDLSTVMETFTLTDYQIVNGCQTSNVLFENREAIADDVLIPVRIIHTIDEDIKDLITRATNSQTEIKQDQFASRLKFSRDLETLFPSYPDPHKLYYERRDGQYDRGAEPRIRVIEPSTVLRSYAAIFKEIPHSATKNYRSIRDSIGDDYFAENHKHSPYYYGAYSWFRLESLFRAKAFDSKYKSARFHILMTVNLLINSGTKVAGNSKEIAVRTDAALKVLWDDSACTNVFAEAISVIDKATEGNLNRDNVRTEAITNSIIRYFRPIAEAR